MLTLIPVPEKGATMLTRFRIAEKGSTPTWKRGQFRLRKGVSQNALTCKKLIKG